MWYAARGLISAHWHATLARRSIAGLSDPHKVEDIELHLRYQGCEAGPLFWAHYSFLGLDPTNLFDKYCPGYLDEMRNLTPVSYTHLSEK